MRVKDLKGHIFILLFIVVCFVAVNIVYDIGLTSVIEKNALSEAESNINSTSDKITIELNRLVYKLEIGTSDSINVTNNLAEDYNRLFFNTDYTLAYNTSMEKGVKADDKKVYIYIRTYNNGWVVGRLELASLFSVIRDTTENPIYLISYSGEVIYTNKEYETKQIFSIIRENNDDRIIEEFKEYTSNPSREVFAFKVNIGGQVGHLASTRFNTFLLLDFLPKSNAAVSSSNLDNLRLAYFTGIGILLILLLVVVIFMLRRALGGSGIGSNSSRKTTNIVLIVKGNGKIVKSNKTFKYLFDDNEIPIKSITDLNSVNELDIRSEIKRQGIFKAYFEKKDGSKMYLEFLSVKHNNDYTLVGKDITKEYLEQIELFDISSKSNITDDANSFMFLRRYRELKEEYRIQKNSFYILMFTLKEFKELTNLLGFNSGNQVIKMFSKKLHDFYPNEEIYHIEHDEFLVLSTKSQETELVSKVDSLINELKAPIKIGLNEIFMRPAVALITSEMDSDPNATYEDLMEKIHLTMSRSKSIVGRSLVKYDDTIENAVKKQRDMEEDLKNAIINNEFVMFYQPQYHLSSERVCGFEGLIRWNNPKYVNTSPQVYIEVAEKNGYINDIGHFINADIFKTAKEMEQYNIHISVNVSPAQIVQAGFVGELIAEFEKNKLKPGSIAIEITETFLMENFQVVIEKLKVLKKHGFSVHLDDFGTGYSSMLYLKELPIDTIKVDREFIKHIETDKFSKILTSKIISLAKELGDKVICEGVENKTQKDIVQKYGADIIQGYYIGKPLSKENAFLLLKTGKVSSENKT